MSTAVCAWPSGWEGVQGQGCGGRAGGAHQPLSSTNVHPQRQRARVYRPRPMALVQEQRYDDSKGE